MVSPTYGYLAAGTGDSSPYRPRIAVNCKLIRASDAKLLMEDKVLYNPLGTVSKVVSLSPDPNYSFTDFDALTASPDKATEGLKVAFGQTADAIATLLQ